MCKDTWPIKLILILIIYLHTIKMLTFELNADNTQEGLPLFNPYDTLSVISNKNVKFGLVWP